MLADVVYLTIMANMWKCCCMVASVLAVSDVQGEQIDAEVLFIKI